MRKKYAGIKTTVSLFVAVVMFLSAGCAASGNSQQTDQYTEPTESADRYTEPAENVETKADPMTVSLQDLPSNSFSLCYSSYDGSTLILAYEQKNMIYPVEFGYSPTNIEDLNFMGRWYISTGWKDITFPEDYDHIEKMLREKEQCGFVLRYIYLGDHVCLTDGTDLGPRTELNEDGTVVMKWSDETAGLPYEAKDRDALDLVLTIREVLSYHYKDGEKYYYSYEALGEKTVVVTVGRSASENSNVQAPPELSGA